MLLYFLFKDDQRIENSEQDSRITVSDDSTILSVTHIKAEDEGKYTCIGESRVGKTEKLTLLTISSKLKIN